MTTYIFTKTVFQAGGGTSEGTLMLPDTAGQGDHVEPKIRQYFQTHGFSEVEYTDLTEFCKYLATDYYGGDRSVFYLEQANSTRLSVFTVHPDSNELFMCGQFVPTGEN